MWRLSKVLLNIHVSTRFSKKMKKKKYLESNRNANVIYQNLWEVDIAVLRRSSWSQITISRKLK